MSLAVLISASCAQTRGPGSGDGPAYEGQTVELVVPFGPGGGADVTARLLAPYLRKHLPGNPTVQVVNVEGNGDHRVGTNEFASADPDGTQLLMGSGSTHTGYMFGSPGVEYDLKKFTPLMGFSLDNVIFAHPRTGVRSAADILQPAVPLFSGGSEPVGGELYRVSSYHLLGAKVQELWGYGGQNTVLTAYRQGEINLGGATTPSYQQSVRPLVDSGEATPLYTMGQVQDGELVRSRAFPDLPHIGEVYQQLHGRPASSLGPQYEALKAQIAAGLTLSKSLWVHGDAPDEARNALLEAARAIAADPEFLAEAGAELGGYEPIVGAELDASIAQNIEGADQAAIEWLRQDVLRRYQIDLG